jgi:hypothetical protein
MAEMRIHWKIERMDEGDVRDPRFAVECYSRGSGVIDAPLQHMGRPVPVS